MAVSKSQYPDDPRYTQKTVLFQFSVTSLQTLRFELFLICKKQHDKDVICDCEKTLCTSGTISSVIKKRASYKCVTDDGYNVLYVTDAKMLLQCIVHLSVALDARFTMPNMRFYCSQEDKDFVARTVCSIRPFCFMDY